MLREILNAQIVEKLEGLKAALQREEELREVIIVTRIGTEDKVAEKIVHKFIGKFVDIRPHEIWPYTEVKAKTEDLQAAGIDGLGLYQKIEFLFNEQLGIAFEAINVIYEKVKRTRSGDVIKRDAVMWDGDEEETRTSKVELAFMSL